MGATLDKWVCGYCNGYKSFPRKGCSIALFQSLLRSCVPDFTCSLTYLNRYFFSFSQPFVQTYYRICSELVPFFPNRHLHHQKIYPPTHTFLIVSSDLFRWPFWPSCLYLIIFQVPNIISKPFHLSFVHFNN